MIKTCLFLIGILLISTISIAQKSDSTGKLIKSNDAGASMNPSNNIMANISASPDFSVLASAISAAELTDTFSAATMVTLFAPDDRAFKKLAPGIMDTLFLPAHKAELTSLILHHTVAGKITSKDIAKLLKSGNGRATFTSLAGDILYLQINADRNIVLSDGSGNQSVIARFDLQQSNGILYLVNGVLISATK